MNDKEYLMAAIDWVCAMCRDYGLKYRRSDFRTDGNFLCDCSNVAYMSRDAVHVIMKYDFQRCGKALKKVRNEFLEYVHCRVVEDGIRFSFMCREIEIHLMSMDDTSDAVEREKVIRKVQKLLAMNEGNNATENEALMASIRVQRLLAKYHLTLADVSGERSEEPIEQVVSDVGVGKKWKFQLAEVVANSYCCKMFWLNSTQIVFYGYRADCLIARRVFTYLFTVGNRLGNKAVRMAKEEESDTSGVYKSFVSGFCAGVSSELAKQCTALALIVPEKVKQSYDRFTSTAKQCDVSLGAYLKNADFDNTAFQKGVVEGKRALNAQYIEQQEDKVTHGE